VDVDVEEEGIYYGIQTQKRGGREMGCIGSEIFLFRDVYCSFEL
jgi:hypothetical protein